MTQQLCYPDRYLSESKLGMIQTSNFISIKLFKSIEEIEEKKKKMSGMSRPSFSQL
jgi:hypothetical protein